MELNSVNGVGIPKRELKEIACITPSILALANPEKGVERSVPLTSHLGRFLGIPKRELKGLTKFLYHRSYHVRIPKRELKEGAPMELNSVNGVGIPKRELKA